MLLCISRLLICEAGACRPMLVTWPFNLLTSASALASGETSSSSFQCLNTRLILSRHFPSPTFTGFSLLPWHYCPILPKNGENKLNPPTMRYNGNCLNTTTPSKQYFEWSRRWDSNHNLLIANQLLYQLSYAGKINRESDNGLRLYLFSMVPPGTRTPNQLIKVNCSTD